MIDAYPDLDNVDTDIRVSRDATHSSQMLEIQDCVITGHKGYKQAKANHGVYKGRWYYEVDILKMPLGSNARIGWSQISGDLQAPCGYDCFSYSFRADPGSYFHCSVGKEATRGFSESDVVGVLIELPEPNKKQLEILEKWKWKEGSYVKLRRPLPLPKTLNGSKIEYFVNGESLGTAFLNLNLGKYYPAVSLFGSSKVQVNFGPDFKYQVDALPMFEVRKVLPCVSLPEVPESVLAAFGIQSE